jgi:lipooligosaccharide transport system ATP-binding protein
VLELRLDVDDHHGHERSVAGLAERVEVLTDRMLLFTDDGEATLVAVHARGVRPTSSLVRRAGLEDVFLRLTGRQLVD